MRSQRLTANQIEALRYAAGLHDCPPTYSVAYRLQRKGLLSWQGGLRGIRDLHPDHRGLVLTEAGKKALEEATHAKT